MRLTVAGFRLYWRERAAHKETRAAYDRLVAKHKSALVALRVEEQRAADMALAATEPCPMCREIEDERDAALLALDDAHARLDTEIATRVWCEGMLRGEVGS